MSKENFTYRIMFGTLYLSGIKESENFRTFQKQKLAHSIRLIILPIFSRNIVNCLSFIEKSFKEKYSLLNKICVNAL